MAANGCNGFSSTTGRSEQARRSRRELRSAPTAVVSAGAGAVARTRPYLFASSKQIGVTLSRSLDCPVEGAFGADVAIGGLSRFLAAQKITPTSRVFIFNAAGEFVAGRGYFNSTEILACNRAGITVTLPKPMTSGAKSEIGSSSETTEGAPTPPLS
jgi:hypothetical protein